MPKSPPMALLGQTLNLSGPDYQIGADLGQLRGGNLFHSFQDFNLQSFESATFSGPNHIQNVISRVTGGNPSQIDGLFRSTIPGADMYFLNPYGIMFGPNAQLDMQGSFHASTADYLRFSDGGRFDARNPDDNLLTVAPIESFGFLTNSPAKITTQSSRLILAPDQTLSLIGGDIHLTSDTPLSADHTQLIPLIESQSILAVEHGQVNLVSLAGEGEVKLTENDVIVQGEGGQIELDNTLVDMSGYSGGAVFIRSGRFLLDNAIIRSNTLGNIDGKNINLKLTESAMINGLNSEISVLTASQNNAGGISIEVPSLEVTGAWINSGSLSTGQAGDIEIHTKQALFQGGAFIGTGSLGAGRSGDIQLEVEDNLSILGYSPGYRINQGIEFENAKTQIFSVSIGVGNSGDIVINTKNLDMISSTIAADTYGIGKGGHITINAQTARLIDGAEISNTTHNQAQTGYIKMNIIDQLYLSGRSPFVYKALGITWKDFKSSIVSASVSAGSGGTVYIQADHITVTDGGKITAKSEATGNAGNVIIQANKLQVTDNGQISTSAEHAVGGNMTLHVPYLLYLQDGMITTSVHGGSGDGGNISVENPTFAVLNQGQIKAQADAGNGGNIRIAASQFIKSYESFVSASSRLGLDGQVEIESPNENVTESMFALSSDTMDASQMMKKPCKTMTDEEYENRSYFDAHPQTGNLLSPSDLQPSYSAQTTTKITLTKPQKLGQKAINPKHHPMTVTLCKPSPTQIKTQKNHIIPEQLF